MSAARPTDIVVTTIWQPAWLQGYLDNLRRFGREQEVTLRIICDRKTPATVEQAAHDARKSGFQVVCQTLEQQTEYLRARGVGEDYIPWNTDNRRNIGFLQAWESGADVLISIDDDNYCRADSDFVGDHHVVGQPVQDGDAQVASGGAWFNICSRLDAQIGDPFFPRGYPYSARKADVQARLQPLSPGPRATVALNAGLWLDDPDVDAITRLAQRPRVRAAHPGAVILDQGTWSPVNTQNTALTRAAIPAYYYVRMGYGLQGLKIDRFGDILSGYFVQKCAKHLGHAIRIGSPVADHRRTPHNLFQDLYHELAGVVLIEDLLPWLQELRLSGSSYADAYASLADALAAQAPHFKGFVWDQGGRDFLSGTAQHMRTWLRLLAR